MFANIISGGWYGGTKELHGDEEDGIGPMPEQPIDRLLRPLARFLHVEATSGFVLVLCTAIALFAANSSFAESYLAFWNTKITIGFGAFEFRHSLHHVINDGLMAVFFFVIGLEVKREMVHGSLSDWRQASLPIAAALGGMLVPAGLYLAVQYGQPGMRVGDSDGYGHSLRHRLLGVVGRRVPHSLRMLLLSLAIVDDIGAILVIAVGYTAALDGSDLLLAAIGIAVVHLLSSCASECVTLLPTSW